MDDALRMQEVGRATFALADQVLVYERTEPFADAPNTAAIWDLYDRSVTAKLYRVDLASPTVIRALLPQEKRGGYWLGARSPDGTRLAVYRLLDERLAAGVIDLATNRATWFDFVPNYFWLHQRPVWISNDELLYPLVPPGQMPSFLYRPSQVARLRGLWERAFAGDVPSATVLVSTASRGNDEAALRAGQLVRVNATSGAASVVADGYYYDFRLSPDRRFVAVLREGSPLQPESGKGAAMRNDQVRRELVVFELRSDAQATEPCTDCHVALGSASWSADGAEVIFYAARVGESLEASGQWLRFSVRNKRLTPITAGGLTLACREGAPSPGRALLWRDRVLVRAWQVPGAAGRHPLSAADCSRKVEAEARSDWVAIDRRGGYVNLTRRFPMVPDEVLGLSADAVFMLSGGTVWRVDFSGNADRVSSSIPVRLEAWPDAVQRPRDHERRYLGSLPSRTRGVLEASDRIVLLAYGQGRHSTLRKAEIADRLLAVADDGESAAFTRSQDGATQIVLIGLSRSPAILETLNEHLRDVDPGEAREIRYALGGREVAGCALLPPGWRAGTRYPTVVSVYPGRRRTCPSSEHGAFSPHSLQLLAARGYVVLFPYAALEAIRTQARPTQGMMDSALAAVDASVTAGYTDPARLGLHGESQGNHSALEILTQTSRFRAAVAAYGLSNLASHYGSIPLHLRVSWDSAGTGGGFLRYETERSPNYLGAAPWEDPDAYVRNSPVFQADRITTPLLLIHSDFDQFPLQQSEEMFSALYRLRKEATYVTYWGEGHFNFSPANIRDYWERVTAWFDRHLRPTTMPDERVPQN